MSPAQKYRDLTLRLLEARAWHLWSEDQETALLDEMDSVWWQLTEVERSEANEVFMTIKADDDDEIIDNIWKACAYDSRGRVKQESLKRNPKDWFMLGWNAGKHRGKEEILEAIRLYADSIRIT